MARILIADDSQFMRKLLRDLLEKNGHKDNIEAENGKQALELFESKNPDLILLDIIMPEMDGIGVLEKLGKEVNAKRVIIVSAVGQEKMKDKAKELGVKCYIVKPFEKEEEVIEMVKKVLG